jgi:hypothetical protein
MNVVLTVSVDISASDSLYRYLSFFIKSAYLVGLVEPCILYVFNIGCYDWIVSKRSPW